MFVSQFWSEQGLWTKQKHVHAHAHARVHSRTPHATNLDLNVAGLIDEFLNQKAVITKARTRLCNDTTKNAKTNTHYHTCQFMCPYSHTHHTHEHTRTYARTRTHAHTPWEERRKPSRVSLSFHATRMPLPPPPAEALIMTGYPMSLASSTA